MKLIAQILLEKNAAKEMSEKTSSKSPSLLMCWTLNASPLLWAGHLGLILDSFQVEGGWPSGTPDAEASPGFSDSSIPFQMQRREAFPQHTGFPLLVPTACRLFFYGKQCEVVLTPEGLESQLCWLLTLWPKASYCTFLIYNFLLYIYWAPSLA